MNTARQIMVVYPGSLSRAALRAVTVERCPLLLNASAQGTYSCRPFVHNPLWFQCTEVIWTHSRRKEAVRALWKSSCSASDKWYWLYTRWLVGCQGFVFVTHSVCHFRVWIWGRQISIHRVPFLEYTQKQKWLGNFRSHLRVYF